MKLNVYHPEFALKIWDVGRNLEIGRVSNFVTGLGTVCNYGYALSCCYT